MSNTRYRTNVGIVLACIILTIGLGCWLAFMLHEYTNQDAIANRATELRIQETEAKTRSNQVEIELVQTRAEESLARAAELQAETMLV